MDMLLRSDRWDFDLIQLETLTSLPLTMTGLKHICDRRLVEKLPIDLVCLLLLHPAAWASPA